MSWSQRFLDGLRGGRIAFIVEGFDLADWRTAAWRASSRSSGRASGDFVLTRGGWQTAGGAVQPRTWRASTGAFSFGIARSGPLQKILRGQFVIVRAGFQGWTEAAFEPILIGQVANLQQQGASATVVCRDLLSALASRGSTIQGEGGLFAGLTSTGVTLTAGYTAASGTMTVSSTTGLRRQDDGGGALKGCIRVTDGSNQFFRTWTAKTATVLTVSNASYNLNTADVSAASGAGVEEIAYLDDHPLKAAERILRSTGAFSSTTGSPDTLPELWGYGLPADVIDADDIAEGIARTQPASGSADWLIWSEVEQPDAVGFLESFLGPGGHFLAMRQGRLTARPVYFPSSKSDAYRIDDSDLIGEVEWAAFDPDSPTEAGRLDLWSSTGSGAYAATSTSEAVGTLPAETVISLDATPWIVDNVASIKAEIAGRIAYYYLRVPERLTLQLAGLRAAQLAPGDLVSLTSRRIGGRTDRGAGYSDRRGWVAAVNPDWVGGSVRIEVLFVPEDGTIFG